MSILCTILLICKNTIFFSNKAVQEDIPSRFLTFFTLLFHQNFLRPVAPHRGQRPAILKNAARCIDEGILHVADALHHEQVLLLVVHRLVMLVLLDGLVRTDANV